MTENIEPPMMSCTLSPEDFKTRLGWIAKLNQAALLNSRRDDLRLELLYAADAREQVLQMVRGEQACCAFLTFGVRDEGDGIHVTAEAPESARQTADTVFGPFRTKTPSQPSCACCRDTR